MLGGVEVRHMAVAWALFWTNILHAQTLSAPDLKPFFSPPPQYANQLGPYPSPLKFADGRDVRTPADWALRRGEILEKWHALMGPWPALLERPKVETLAEAARDSFTQYTVKLEIAKDRHETAYLLVPRGQGPFPAVLVPFYEIETSVGNKGEHRDFALQLAKRGFVTLAIGTPGGDARDYVRETAGTPNVQPLSYLAYVAANCHTALAQRPEVDAARIGVVGHSYGGKWALFASSLYEKFAAAVWSDPGIVFDEKRGNVNYWEPWYLGLDPALPKQRKPGLITPASPRTGPYKTMMENGTDLHELHALMAPRPFLVSAGSEDPPSRWGPLNHAIAVNKLLGHADKVAMHNRPAHSPTAESNEIVYAFFEHALKRR